MEISLHLPDLVGYWNQFYNWWMAFSSGERTLITFAVILIPALITGKVVYHKAKGSPSDRMAEAVTATVIAPIIIVFSPVLLIMGLLYLFFSFGAKKNGHESRY